MEKKILYSVSFTKQWLCLTYFIVYFLNELMTTYGETEISFTKALFFFFNETAEEEEISQVHLSGYVGRLDGKMSGLKQRKRL